MPCVWWLVGDNRQILLPPPSYFFPSHLPSPVLPLYSPSIPPSLQESVFLLDCRPVLSFSSCHISGAANINLASMMKKRFMAGKIGLVDLISSVEAKEQLKVAIPPFLYPIPIPPHSYTPFLTAAQITDVHI